MESFVVQQVIEPTSCTNPDLRVWHYRDKDQVEVDVVVTLGNETWGIEDKAASILRARDGRGCSRLPTYVAKKSNVGFCSIVAKTFWHSRTNVSWEFP